MLDPNRLRVFRSVVASGSVQAAADNLAMTSSAVSQHLSVLASQTGLTLFERQGRGIVATPAALEVDRAVELVMAQYAVLDQTIADLKEGRTGRVTIGHFSSAGANWMPRLAARLRQEFPNVGLDLVVTETGTHGLQPDLDVTQDPADGTELTRPGYRRVELAVDPFVALVHQSHPFAGREEVPLSDFKGETLISNDLITSVGHRTVVAACVAAGFRPRFPIQAEDHITAIAFVEAGVGVAIMPRMTVRIRPDTVVPVRLRAPEPTRRLVALVRETGHRNLAAERALELLVDVASREAVLST